jgi:hypothetical protein
MVAPEPGAATYWGTTSGAPLPAALRERIRWTAQQLQPEYESVLASWPKTFGLAIPGLGEVLFCHSTPRSETEIFTRLTPEERMLPIFEPLQVSVVVCGHTHMQFDRRVGSTRVVNAGSVGMPVGEPGAFWALLGPGIELRRTPYEMGKAAERLRTTHSPGSEEQARQILEPPSEAEVLERLRRAELR